MVQNNQKSKVRIFSTPACVYCVTLEAFLSDHNIEFEEIDISQDEKAREEMIEKSGQMGVPVIEIGDKIIIGFDKKKIAELLEIKD